MTDQKETQSDGKIMQQMMQVRDSGRANMMDPSAVQRAANDMGLYALVTHLGRRPAQGYGALINRFSDWL